MSKFIISECFYGDARFPKQNELLNVFNGNLKKRNGLHGLVCLNAWPRGNGTIGGMALLE